MQIKSKALAYSAETFHSNKTNSDFHKVGLIIEGTATTMFVNDKTWNNFKNEPCFNAICAAKEPTAVDIEMELKFDEKGCKAYLNGIKAAAKGK